MADAIDASARIYEPLDEGGAQLRAKRDFEGLLLEKPEDATLQRAYFETLTRISRQFAGVLEFRWPGYPYPLYFRCGSTDLQSFAQIFLRKDYDFPLPFAPRRILDLGAYVGYAATFLAHRFPEAEVVSVEPSAANFRLLVMNTAPYTRIRCLNAAVWGDNGRVNAQSATPGDWGMRVVEDTHASNVNALSLPDILRLNHWNDVDLLKCDIEGAEIEVFSRSGACIAGLVSCCAIELHDASAEGCDAAVSACFDTGAFERTRSGEYHVFTRRSVTKPTRRVPAIYLLRPEVGVRAISLQNVPTDDWGYYTFDDDLCQLNATTANGPAAQLTAVIEFSGQDTFDCEVLVENPRGYGVTFGLRVSDFDDHVVASANIDVAAGKGGRWICPIGLRSGPLRVILTTRMISGSPTNYQVRAFWRRPRFCKAGRGESTDVGHAMTKVVLVRA